MVASDWAGDGGAEAGAETAEGGIRGSGEAERKGDGRCRWEGSVEVVKEGGEREGAGRVWFGRGGEVLEEPVEFCVCRAVGALRDVPLPEGVGAVVVRGREVAVRGRRDAEGAVEESDPSSSEESESGV